MIILLLERHADPTGALNILCNKIRQDRKLTHHNCLQYDRSLDYSHPEDQIKILKDITKRCNFPASVKSRDAAHAMHAIISTYSLIPIYYFNNELAKDPNFNIEAYEVIPSSSKRPAHIKSAIKNNWIDESIVGHVYDSLFNNLNKVLSKRHDKLNYGI